MRETDAEGENDGSGERGAVGEKKKRKKGKKKNEEKGRSIEKGRKRAASRRAACLYSTHYQLWDSVLGKRRGRGEDEEKRWKTRSTLHTRRVCIARPCTRLRGDA